MDTWLVSEFEKSLEFLNHDWNGPRYGTLRLRKKILNDITVDVEYETSLDGESELCTNTHIGLVKESNKPLFEYLKNQDFEYYGNDNLELEFDCSQLLAFGGESIVVLKKNKKTGNNDVLKIIPFNGTDENPSLMQKELQRKRRV